MIRVSLILLFCHFYADSLAQAKNEQTDTFFLSKQKGILGKLGKSISRSPVTEPEKIVNPFLPFANKVIRSVEVYPLGFERNIDDTSLVKDSKWVHLANKLHRDTRYNVIRKNLFFKPGDHLLPLLVSDNEAFLRNLPYLRDARIQVVQADEAPDSVDVFVVTRDVFSIGGRFSINTQRARAELREENVFGSGNELSVGGLLDKNRSPLAAVATGFRFLNIGGSFLNWYGNFNNFNAALQSGRLQENQFYTRLEKPFINRYTQWTANLEMSLNYTQNAYTSDSVYISDLEYRYHNIDLWAGYNIGYKKKKGSDSENRLRHFVAGRVFYTHFINQPGKYDTGFYYLFANKNGALFTYTLYRQNYYRTNFLYSFGRSEDVPVGLSAGIIAGWANIQNRRTPYYGIDLELAKFYKKSFYSDYKFRLGGFHRGGRFEDVNLLVSIDHFTRLRRLNSNWLNRTFINFSYSRQFNYRYNDPLFLRSDFGLPYFPNIEYPADERTTLRLETDFYNLKKILGFRFAPFVFGDVSFLRGINYDTSSYKGYPAVGAGIRTRNENLIFETIELRGFYFPVTINNMHHWKVALSTRIRFKLISNLIKKPDFVNVN